MSFFMFILSFSFMTGLLSMLYKKSFFLSILLSLEIMLLKLIMFNFALCLQTGEIYSLSFSLFLMALAAVEASIGMSIITLITRKFSQNNLKALKLLNK